MPSVTYQKTSFLDFARSTGVEGFEMRTVERNQTYMTVHDATGKHVADIHEHHAWVWQHEALEAVTKVASDFELACKPHNLVEVHCGFTEEPE